jgi:hypothetical protein
MEGGSFEISSGDDGIHADEEININDGEINIKKSYEGIESLIININGGTIWLISSDDGINAAGGNDGSSIGGRPGQNFPGSGIVSGNGKINIKGGYIIVNASGDGIDSNGSITMTGGTAVIYGPTVNNNGALDYDATFLISGGLLIASGSSGMAQAPSASSTQKSISFKFSSTKSSNTIIYISCNGFNITIKPPKQFSSVVVSSPLISNGSGTVTYGCNTNDILTDNFSTSATCSGGTSKSFTVSSVVTNVMV